jgi:hypothetical protein
MSVRTCMHFMSHSGGPLPKIEMRRHPSLPIVSLTLLLNDQDFTLSDTPERIRELCSAILAQGLLMPKPVPACCALSPWGHMCMQKPGHAGDHATGGEIMQWSKDARLPRLPPLPEKPAAPPPSAESEPVRHYAGRNHLGPACGADVPNQSTTEIPSRVTCAACRPWVPPPSGQPPARPPVSVDAAPIDGRSASAVCENGHYAGYWPPSTITCTICGGSIHRQQPAPQPPPDSPVVPEKEVRDILTEGREPAALKDGVAPALGRCYGHLGPPPNTNTPHPENGTCFDWRADPLVEEQQSQAPAAPVDEEG